MRALTLLMALSALAPLSGCVRGGDRTACLDGSGICAASEVPPGMRAAELRGHRIRRYRWLQRRNRESGVPDVGLQAEWEPIRERR